MNANESHHYAIFKSLHRVICWAYFLLACGLAGMSLQPEEGAGYLYESIAVCEIPK